MSSLAVEETQIPLAADDFNALEQRVLRMVELVKSEREARTAAEARIQSLEATVKSLEDSGLNAEQRVIAAEERLREAHEKIAQLTAQTSQAASHADSLEREREIVRQRVEKLLKHLEEVSA
jgi:chromosome segregation ATPase